MKLGKKKKDSRPPDWLFFCPPGSQERIFYLRVASFEKGGYSKPWPLWYFPHLTMYSVRPCTLMIDVSSGA